MDAKRWAVIESVYHAALEKEPGERSAYLAVACAEDAALRNEIESLLGHADANLSSPLEPLRVTELLHKMGGIALSNATEPVAPGAAGIAPALPVAIGRYRIVRLLGQGGMGVVYEAEQEQPRRTVALKVIKPGLAGTELLRRFEQESQALGRLQHPGIAQIHEAGTADTGYGPQPYFAMEFIRGESLLEYAGTHELNTRQRLELMAKVCEAVHHAHQRGIIHRDLKPGNILVDESGQPKVLDFGVARVTDSDTRATRQTDVGRLVGTLAYMSPEQVLADPLELDTRSDVYALGVILCELLTGRLPYSISGNLPEAVRTIREADPARLSSVNRTYRGDIETIVAKALEKDKARRYASAAGMAGDIRRYLTDEPIAARPPSAKYQLQKFARRHKAMVAGIAAVFVALLAGIIASTWEAARARRAEQAATTEAATAKAVNDFLQNDLLAQASANTQARPDTKPDPDLKVRTALDRAATRIPDKFNEQPLVEASIRQTIGNTYRDLGLYPDAQRHVERALDLRRRAVGEEHPDTAASAHKLAELYWYQGKYAQAEPLFTKALAVRRRVLGPEHPDTLASMHCLAITFYGEGRYTMAEQLQRQTLDIRRRVLGPEHPDTVRSMNNLGVILEEEGRYAEAEKLYREAVYVYQRILGSEHPGTLMLMSNLADTLAFEGRNVEAEKLDREALDIRRKVLGPEHPDTVQSIVNLATALYDQHRYGQAEKLDREALDIRRKVLGPEHPDTLKSLIHLANDLHEEGRYAEARMLYRQALDIRRKVLGPEHPATLRSMRNLAETLALEGNDSEADKLYRQALEIERRVLGPEDPETLNTMNDLAHLRLKQGSYAQAEVLVRDALNAYQKTMRNTWDRYNCQSLLGASLAGKKEYADAEPLLLSGYEGMLQRKASIPAGKLVSLEQAGKWIVELYMAWGKPDKAAEWREKLGVSTSSGRTRQRM